MVYFVEIMLLRPNLSSYLHNLLYDQNLALLFIPLIFLDYLQILSNKTNDMCYATVQISQRKKDCTHYIRN